MAFKVVVRENSVETSTNTHGVTQISRGLPEISDEYPDDCVTRIDEGRLEVNKKEKDGVTTVAIYQDWCRVVPIDKKESK